MSGAGSPQALIDVLTFERDVAEVSLLIDHVSGRSEKSLKDIDTKNVVLPPPDGGSPAATLPGEPTVSEILHRIRPGALSAGTGSDDEGTKVDLCADAEGSPERSGGAGPRHHHCIYHDVHHGIGWMRVEALVSPAAAARCRRVHPRQPRDDGLSWAGVACALLRAYLPNVSVSDVSDFGADRVGLLGHRFRPHDRAADRATG